MIMIFGKYKGRDSSIIPLDYCESVLSCKWQAHVTPTVVRAMKKQIKRIKAMPWYEASVIREREEMDAIILGTCSK